MANSKWLIVGLGNPGKKYECNRHNIGWMVADSFAAKHNATFQNISAVGYFTKITFKGNSALLIKPTTYMNNSGNAVLALTRKFGISSEQILVIVDEYNFEVGKLHLKNSGSDGGHNGTASIIYRLGTDKFYRLRCGIGSDFPSGELVDYVLTDFPEKDIDKVKIMIDQAVASIETVIEFGAARAMTLINSGRLWRPKTQKLEENSDDKL